ncbi:hypothetical protein QBC38DRAFT_72348 [Podospora fimiseda]|uniref:Uncharacterized protein n=1 Tax=Podospora fimiseda TaxID=252190 RepID=A0AAN6YTB8_9PEZI|nr:hypothetical protein QBC38DRAFT_72348 [Podospora fimiseda]
MPDTGGSDPTRDPAQSQVPDTEFEKRPWTEEYSEVPTFTVADEVWLINDDGNKEGPYLVAEVVSKTSYKLSDDKGNATSFVHTLTQSNITFTLPTQ